MRDANIRGCLALSCSFARSPGVFLCSGGGGGYVPPSTAQIYHPNRKMDPGFPIYTENKSAYGAATENKQPEHPT